MSIDTDDVGGPSAGLAVDARDHRRADTGEPDRWPSRGHDRHDRRSGTVGPIGGIQQKTFLATERASSLFLVPADEFTDAKQYAGDDGSSMKVVSVAKLDDALAALKADGGHTDEVDQAAAAHTVGSATPAH